MAGTILITGATGKVGREVIDQLAQRNISPRAAVRDKNKAADLGQKAELVTFDFKDEGTWDKALKGIEKVMLITPVDMDMVDMTERFVRRAKEAGVKHIVRLSALGASDEATMTLGRWHRDAERAIEESGISWTHLRPSSFMQNLFGMADAIKQSGKLYLPLGDAKVSYVDTRDIAAVASSVLTTEGHEGKVYDITGMQTLSGHDIARELSAVTGREVKYEAVTDEQARQALAQMGMPSWMVDAMMELYAQQRDGGYDQTTPAIKEITNRDPILFSQFAEENKEAFA